MSAPYEIVVGPLTLYLAPVATAFPSIDTAPSGSWIKVGTSGAKNYDDGGVAVGRNQTVETFTPAGSTAPQKAFRTEEALEIGVTLVDVSPTQYAQAYNNATVTTVAASTGVPGTKAIPLLQGFEVATFALLARGKSSVNDALACQYQVPICFQSGSPSEVWDKGAPVKLELSFMALEDSSNGFGKLIEQTAVAT